MIKHHCVICHKELNYKPIRLVKQEYAKGRFKQYYNVKNYDFCLSCYKVFEKWLEKHNKV